MFRLCMYQRNTLFFWGGCLFVAEIHSFYSKVLAVVVARTSPPKIQKKNVFRKMKDQFSERYCSCSQANAKLWHQWRQRWMWCNLTVHTEVTLENTGYVSDLGPHMKRPRSFSAETPHAYCQVWWWRDDACFGPTEPWHRPVSESVMNSSVYQSIVEANVISSVPQLHQKWFMEQDNHQKYTSKTTQNGWKTKEWKTGIISTNVETPVKTFSWRADEPSSGRRI